MDQSHHVSTLHERPLRILQAHTFYQDYLRLFYAQNPSLLRLNSSEQTKLLIQDGLAAIHILTPYLKNLGCETQFVILNGNHVQNTWAAEHHLPLSGQWEVDEVQILRAQIEAFMPDVLYLVGDPFRYGEDFFASLHHRPPLIMSWRASDIPLNMDWTGYDIILSGLPRLLAFATTAGAKEGAFFVPGMPHWIAREVKHIPHDVDVVFIGGISPTQHGQRLAVLDAVAQAATQHGFSLRLHLSCPPHYSTEAMRPYLAPPVYGLEMHRALRRGRIVVDCRGTAGLRHPNGSYILDFGGDELCTMRQFEATGGGSLLITENLGGIKRYFEPGKEVITCATTEEYITSILHFIKHPDERACIANKGQERCMRDWSMNSATQRFMRIVTEALAHKN